MVQVKIAQLMFAASVAAAALGGFGGSASAAPTTGTAPSCAEGALTTVVDDSGVEHQACVESAAAVTPAAVQPALESSATPAPSPVPIPSTPAHAGSPARLPTTGAGTGGLVIAALLVGSGSLASLLSRRRS